MMSLQDRYAPTTHCFGCGPVNDRGLRIKSFEDGEAVIADWMPAPHHEAFDGILNGGIIGTLLDCHSNWAAAVHLMRRAGADRIPPTVTAEFHVRLRRPASSRSAVHLRACVVESTDDRAVVEAELLSNGEVAATCRGVFVAVGDGHPAAQRWDDPPA